MPSIVAKSARATLADVLAIPEDQRFHEVIRGDLVRKASPSARHGAVQANLTARLDPYNRKPGGRHPGGWWFACETEIDLELHEVYRPDVAGWRRERLPALPLEFPVRVRPDWVCEVISPSKPKNDRVAKFEVYRRCGVPHYWIVDPALETLTVYRWTADGYLVAVNASRGDRVRAEPFDAIELAVGVLFGDDPED